MKYSQYKHILYEGVKTSVIRVNKFKKRRAFAGRSAIAMAQAKNPGLYRKYKRYKDLHMQLKLQITKKYGSRTRMMANKTIR